jgi:glycosyltransferase involved in cell wall biosynthesis
MMRLMALRICEVITKLELGGAQQVALFLCRALSRPEFEVTLIAGCGGLLDEEARQLDGVDVIFLPSLVREIRPLRDIAALFHLRRIFRAGRFDVVHTHSSKAGVLGRIAARLAGIPSIIHTYYGFGFTHYQSPARRRLLIAAERLAARCADFLVPVSRDNMARALQLSIGSPGQYRVIVNGIPVEEFCDIDVDVAAVKAELGIPGGAPTVGMIAPLKPQKAPLDFVGVADRVIECIPEAHFVLVGDGELRCAVEEEIGRLGLGGHIHLLGWRRDVAQLLSAFDVFLLTSLWEGLPMVCPQAMCRSKPIVATRVDGTPEAVLDGRNGLLADPGDVETLSRHVLQLLRYGELARSMGEEGRRMVSEFSDEVMLRRFENLYRETALLPGKDGPLGRERPGRRTAALSRDGAPVGG